MVDDENGASSRQARWEFIDKWTKLTEKIDKDWQEILKNSDFDKSKVEKYLSDYDIKNRELHFIYSRWKEKDKIGFDKVKQDILFHESKFLSLLSQLNEIQNKLCNKCSKKISEKKCYLYFSETKSIQEWTVEKSLKFNHEQFYTLFCPQHASKIASILLNQKPKLKLILADNFIKITN